jgi:lipid-A-disaccharide synthase
MKEDYKIWIIAGESSGDTYGAELARDIRKQMPGKNVSISGMGGSKMKEAGIDIMVDSTELGVVGLIEVLKHIFVFIKIFRFLVKKAEEERPDAVVLIDYPGFNIRFAKQMYKRNIPVIWYVSPQVWAWRKSNIPKLKPMRGPDWM